MNYPWTIRGVSVDYLWTINMICNELVKLFLISSFQ